MALRAEVIDFVGTNVVDELGQKPRIAQVPVMQKELRLAVDCIGVFVNVVNAVGVEHTRTANDAVDGIALRKQEFGKVRAILGL